MNQLIILIKQKYDEEFWVKLRNYLYFNNRELFNELEKYEFELIGQKENTVNFKEVNKGGRNDKE